MSNTPPSDDIEQQQERLLLERARLADLLKQEAKLGSAWVPPGVTSGIREARTNIKRIKATLHAWGIAIAEHPDDVATAADTIDTQAPLFAFPFDSIPEPAALPPGSRMPLSRNRHFVGRTAELQAIAQALHGGPAVAAITAAISPALRAQQEQRSAGEGPSIAAATGMGGIGKSNLAVEFVHRYGQYFTGGVFWLSFANPADVSAEVAACGGSGALDLPGFSALNPEDQVARV